MDFFQLYNPICAVKMLIFLPAEARFHCAVQF